MGKWIVSFLALFAVLVSVCLFVIFYENVRIVMCEPDQVVGQCLLSFVNPLAAVFTVVAIWWAARQVEEANKQSDAAVRAGLVQLEAELTSELGEANKMLQMIELTAVDLETYLSRLGDPRPVEREKAIHNLLNRDHLETLTHVRATLDDGPWSADHEVSEVRRFVSSGLIGIMFSLGGVEPAGTKFTDRYQEAHDRSVYLDDLRRVALDIRVWMTQVVKTRQNLRSMTNDIDTDLTSEARQRLRRSNRFSRKKKKDGLVDQSKRRQSEEFGYRVYLDMFRKQESIDARARRAQFLKETEQAARESLEREMLRREVERGE